MQEGSLFEHAIKLFIQPVENILDRQRVAQYAKYFHILAKRQMRKAAAFKSSWTPIYKPDSKLYPAPYPNLNLYHTQLFYATTKVLTLTLTLSLSLSLTLTPTLTLTLTTRNYYTPLLRS